jgi:hypothetical protein
MLGFISLLTIEDHKHALGYQQQSSLEHSKHYLYGSEYCNRVPADADRRKMMSLFPGSTTQSSDALC